MYAKVLQIFLILSNILILNHLDQYVVNLLIETILDEKNINKLHKMINEQIRKSSEGETAIAAAKKKQLKDLERKIESTVNLMIEDNDVKLQKILMQKMNEMTDEKELLEEELRTMNVGTDVEEVSI